MKLIISILSILFAFSTSQDSEYPTPKTKNLLFYIQRTHNKNTIVYDANFDKDGNLNPEKPVVAYWIRYEEQGQKMPLRSYEKWMAYGIKAKKLKNSPYDYRLYLSASSKVVLWLKQTAPFKAEVITLIDGKISKLDRMFANLDESGWIPKVNYGEFFGHDLKTGEKTYKKVFPKDIK